MIPIYLNLLYPNIVEHYAILLLFEHLLVLSLAKKGILSNIKIL